ncbi:hypothetical protein ACIA58_31340 [Kribbella sp. NPDC051586]|uniref:AbiTii domain-containing protein n=1 Tax=Kribbella sp. NPDC051586 TaxID=3364118 RepID=UPI0037AD5ECD
MFNRRRKHPLRAIQLGAMNRREPVTDLLRQIIALGGRTGSQELMDWARRELNGYGPEDPLPDYRLASTPLQIDGMTPTAQIRQQTLAPFDLPDVAQDHISNDLALRMSISEIEHLAKETPRGDVVKLSPPGADDLVSIMNRMGTWTGHIERLYWSVSPVVFVGVLEGVRTTLVSLTAQMEAVTPPAANLPSPEGTAASVALVVYGDRSKIKNVTIYNAGADISIAADGDKKGPWRRRWWAIAGGLITLAGAGLALMQVQGWRF